MFRRYPWLLVACKEVHGKEEAGMMLTFPGDYAKQLFSAAERPQTKHGYPG